MGSRAQRNDNIVGTVFDGKGLLKIDRQHAISRNQVCPTILSA